ncbi:MAG: VOC family protein [Myxococcales bacterium]|nr:VOC family protein [Myxococcales bacterium]
MRSANGSGPQVGALHHVEIYVSNLERSRVFWGWLLTELGYEKFQEWDQGTSWKCGETYLVFVQTEEAHLEPPYHRCKTGLNHLAFHAGSRENVDRLVRGLREREATLLYEDRHPYAGGEDYYAAFFEDPDRIKVELVADTTQ